MRSKRRSDAAGVPAGVEVSPELVAAVRRNCTRAWVRMMVEWCGPDAIQLVRVVAESLDDVGCDATLAGDVWRAVLAAAIGEPIGAGRVTAGARL